MPTQTRHTVGCETGSCWSTTRPYRGTPFKSCVLELERCGLSETSVMPTAEFVHQNYCKPKAPISCPLTGVAVLMKDNRPEVRRQKQRTRTCRFRLRRCATMKKRMPKKKHKDAKRCPTTWTTLPVLMPYQLFKTMVQAGLINHWLL